MIAYGMEHGLRDSMDRLAELTAQEPEPARSQVVIDISMSLDGFVTGPNADLDNGLGDDGEVLHIWALEGDAADRAVLDGQFVRTGAVIQGRKLFDIIDGPHGWSDEMGYGAQPEGDTAPPIFVVTHSMPGKTRLGDRFNFVTDGVESAVQQAQAVAKGKDVVVMGGGEICHRVLAAGLADILRVHVAPVVLGDGTRLFPADSSARVALELVEAVSTPAAQHLTYRVTQKEN
jgi:dihydrofolate reductase